MKNIEIVHLEWKEFPFNDDIYNNFNGKSDYGIYQIYGDHPVYGENILLYIGKAQDQTYSQRLNGHNDFNETHIPKFRRIHLSYFYKTDDVNYKNWGESIDIVERLLINSHFPAYNSQDVKGIIDFKPLKKMIC
jgi:hypothetical protein